MQNYLILLLAAVLLAGDFALQKIFEKKAGTGISTGLAFNMTVGLVTAVLFFALNGFTLTVTLYGAAISTVMSVSVFLYTVIGFRIMRYGNMALYSLFSLMGAIVVPYTVGVLFLGERSTVPMLLGVILILLSTVLSNISLKGAGVGLFLLCTAVFFLNGAGAVISKLCQMDLGQGTVAVNDFVCMTGISKFILCAAALAVYSRKGRHGEAAAKRAGISVGLFFVVALSAVVGGVSYMLQLIGAARLPASLLFPMVSGAGMIFTSLTGALVFRERPSLRQTVGVGLCFIGTLLLAL